MNMIFFKTDSENVIDYTHFNPFDERDGLMRSEEELLKIGFLVDEIPSAPTKEGMNSITKYVNGEFVFEYKEIVLPPLTEIEQLKAQQALMQTAIDDIIMGGMM